MKLGISIKENIGIGDKVQFSSLPENYFRATGEKLIDVSKAWIFDHNPYVDRESTPEQVTELWNFAPTQYAWPRPRADVYLSNAEIWASLFKVPTVLNRPRLYRYEEFPIDWRDLILFHPFGRSHGALPDHVIDHVLKKYGHTGRLRQVGLATDPDVGCTRIHTKDVWELAHAISEASFFIGIDSGPAWIAACYPAVRVKKIRVRPVHGEKELKDWIPLEINNFHSYWDDRIFEVHNTTEEDVGFTASYKCL